MGQFVLYYINLAVYRILISPLVYLVSSYGRCKSVFEVIKWSLMAQVLSVSTLFLLRARAVLLGHRYTTMFFTCTWIFTVLSLIIIPFFAFGHHSDVTGLCSVAETPVIILIPFSMSIVHETAIFFAVSLKLYFLDTDGETGVSPAHLFLGFFSGKGLSWLTRTLLQSSQLYFL